LQDKKKEDWKIHLFKKNKIKSKLDYVKITINNPLVKFISFKTVDEASI